MKETSVKMNKPIYLGLATLSLSKILMYDCWYNEMKPKYKDRIRLCWMDTDSFIMHINYDIILIFIKILLMMLKKSMIHQIILLKDHYQWVKIKK